MAALWVENRKNIQQLLYRIPHIKKKVVLVIANKMTQSDVSFLLRNEKRRKPALFLRRPGSYLSEAQRREARFRTIETSRNPLHGERDTVA